MFVKDLKICDDVYVYVQKCKNEMFCSFYCQRDVHRFSIDSDFAVSVKRCVL